jgi:hypothetical protein
MEEQSSMLRKLAAVGAVAGALAIGAFAVTGCGSDEEDNPGKNALDNLQSQVDSAQSVASSVATKAQEQAQSVQSQVQSQVESVKSQIQTQTQSNGGSSAGGY